MAPKRKLQSRRSPLIFISSSFSEAARSPTPLLPPLLLRLVLLRRTQRQERRVLPGYDSASCRFLPFLQRHLSLAITASTLAATTIDTTTRSYGSTTLLPLLLNRLATTTVLATMLLRTASSQPQPAPAGLVKHHILDPRQPNSSPPLRRNYTKANLNASGTTNRLTHRRIWQGNYPPQTPILREMTKTGKTHPQRPALPTCGAHNYNNGSRKKKNGQLSG
jgi:hypothetical protein